LLKNLRIVACDYAHSCALNLLHVWITHFAVCDTLGFIFVLFFSDRNRVHNE